MDRSKNPYRPGAGTTPPALVGRDELVDDFRVALRRALAGRPGKSYMPLGLRGVGKTVLLNRFAEIAAEEGMKVGFIEVPETGDLPHMMATRLRRILIELSTGRVSRAVNKALGVLKSFELQLPEGVSLRLSVDALAGQADSGLLAEDLTDLLVSAGEAAAEDGSGLLFAIDEVQYLAREELGAVITAIHRTTQLDLPVVLVGAGLPQLAGLAGEAKSYSERLFEFQTINSLGEPEAAQAIVAPARDLGVEFETDAVDQIVRESRGYPYFLQEWGYRVWNQSPRSPVTADDVGSSRPEVIRSLDESFFRVRFDRLTPKEKQYLAAMARLGPGPHRSGDIASELGVKVQSVAPRRSALIAKGMIYSPTHGDTAFTVPLFDQFLQRQKAAAI